MKLSTLLTIAICTLVGCASHKPTAAPSDGGASQATFASADAAVQALVEAVRANDRPRIQQILGPGSDDVINSGDAAADLRAGQQFVAAYDLGHHLVQENNGSVTLDTGAADWPFPIPIVKDDKTGQWLFDTSAGREEILNRRIGKNEREAIQVCQAIMDAEREYAQRNPDADGVPEYTDRFTSDPGTKDGLYWPTAEGEPPSPLGPLVGQAVAEGYGVSSEGPAGPQGYRGYFYRILKSQGPHALDGARDYVVDGKLIGGIAVIAWPARYGNSGVMTFIVNHAQVVYQKDLGPDTETAARAVTAFDPGTEWAKVE